MMTDTYPDHVLTAEEIQRHCQSHAAYCLYPSDRPYTAEEKERHAKRFRGSFEGTISSSELTQVKSGPTHLFYKCPCGGVNHLASRSQNYDTGKSITASPVLHCYETGMQWMIENDVAAIIRREEAAYGKLLDKYASIAGESFGAAEAFRLWSEQGVPMDILDVTEPDEFNRLVGEHKAKSGKRR